MLRVTRQSTLEVGQTVRVGIPDVDRARNQARNILAIITDVSHTMAQVKLYDLFAAMLIIMQRIKRFAGED